MPISSQFPAPAVPTRGGALEALALQAGQVISAKVIGPAPNGGTQVQIGDHLLNLVLPVPVKPGAVLQMEVAGSGSQLRLILQPQQAAAATPQPVQTGAPLSGIPTPSVTPQPATGAPAQMPVSLPPVAAPQTVLMSTPPQPAVQQALSTPLRAQLPAAQPAAATLPTVSYAAATPSAAAPQQAVPVPLPPTQHPQATTPANMGRVAAGPTVQMAPPPSTGTVPSAPPRPPATPESALAQMVQTSVQRQGSLAALTSALASIAGKVTLPEPVARAAQQVMAGRVSLNTPIDGAMLQKAVLTSGIFQETALKSGQTPAQTDLKSALLTLRQTLSSWLGSQAAPVQPAPMAPPVRGGVLRARAMQEAGGIDPASTTAEEAGKILLDLTEAALSRIRLHQHASLPDPTGKQGGDWSLDLPVLVGNHQTLLQMQIHRDGRSGGEQENEPGWQMRFALNLPALGEVGAQVSLRGGATGIMLWAGEPETAALLESELPELRTALAATGLRAGSIVVRRGEPSAAQAPSGHFLDAQT